MTFYMTSLYAKMHSELNRRSNLDNLYVTQTQAAGSENELLA